MLAAGLWTGPGCSCRMTSRRGRGCGEQQHPLGHEVTRVLAGVPANLYLVAEEPPSGSGGQSAAYLVLTEQGREAEIEVRDGYRPEPHPAAGDHHHLPTLHELALAEVGNGACATSRG